MTTKFAQITIECECGFITKSVEYADYDCVESKESGIISLEWHKCPGCKTTLTIKKELSKGHLLFNITKKPRVTAIHTMELDDNHEFLEESNRLFYQLEPGEYKVIWPR